MNNPIFLKSQNIWTETSQKMNGQYTHEKLLNIISQRNDNLNQMKYYYTASRVPKVKETKIPQATWCSPPKEEKVKKIYRHMFTWK